MSHHLYLFSIGEFVSEHKDLLIVLLIGAIAGYLAEYLVPGPGYGLLFTIGVGIVGGWLGDKFFSSFIHINSDIPYINDIICSTLGAMIVVIILNLLLRKAPGRKEKDVYEWENE
jgi:uncharacterized membrane protein YeaQ/YmgE (transglycosylase-associated protein family)